MFKPIINPIVSKLTGIRPSTIRALPVLATCVLVLCFGFSCNLFAQGECDFTQINTSGFEPGTDNYYAWAMTEFQDPDTLVTYLYTTTHNLDGGQVWRMNVATPGIWEKVLDANDYSRADENSGFRNIAVFKGRIYIGSRNQSGSCELWRSDENGLNFKMMVGPMGDFADDDFSPVLGPGFGDPIHESVRGLQVFGDYLYIGLQGTLGGAGLGELWRTVDGDAYEQMVLPDAMGGAGSNNNSMHTMAVHDDLGLLYVAVRNLESGFQLWSWDGVTYNGGVAAFTPIVGSGGEILSGFGDSAETTVLDIHIHNDYLFLGTARPAGFSVFRINLYNYADSVRVASGGLGDRWAYYAWRFESFGDVGDGTKYLWLGTYNYLPGFFPYSRKGAALYRSADNGDNWDLMVGGSRWRDPGYCGIGYGFDDRQNWGIRSFKVIDSTMYIGVAACLGGGCPTYEGCEVWALEDWTLPY